MTVTLTYFAQIRRKAGVESETVTATDGTTVHGVLAAIQHGAEFGELLFEKTGALRPVILLVVNGLPSTPERMLRDGDSVQVFSPVAGG